MKRSEVAGNTNTVYYLLHNNDSAPINDKSHTAKPSDSNVPDVSTYHKDNE